MEAYQRALLLMERIHPGSLVMRLQLLQRNRDQQLTLLRDKKTDVETNNKSDNTNKISDSNTKSIKKLKFVKIPDLPKHVSLFKDKDSFYLQYSKNIDTIRYNKKNIMQYMCIQTELNRLIHDINEKYPNLKIENYTIKNPYDFIDKTPLKEPNDKPLMPKNFSMCDVNNIRYIQFCKTINGKRLQYKTTLKSDNIQLELNKFVEYLNTTYKLDLAI